MTNPDFSPVFRYPPLISHYHSHLFPSASSASAASPKSTRIFIDRFGDIYVDNQQIRIYSLQSKLRDILRVSTDKTILVVTDETVPAKVVLEVIDQAKLSGATDVGVATEQEASI